MDELIRKIAKLEREVERLKLAEMPTTGAGVVGEIKMWVTNTAPDEWLLCYGQAVSRTTYADLFAVIGTIFGVGDGSTTFNLPDFRGRTPLGQDDMGGSSANRVTAAAADSIGGSGGEETHVLTVAEMPSHTHIQNAHNHPPAAGGTFAITGTSSSYLQASGTSTLRGEASQNATATNQNTGGDGAHNNMPPYLTLNFIIYVGV